MLTKEIAEQRILVGEYHVDLSEFTSIEDDAAESLSKLQGGLSLNGLTEITDAAAESLSRFQGDYLYLDGLTELSDAAALFSCPQKNAE